MSTSGDSFVPRRRRPSAAVTAVRLYKANTLFRSSLDFALIGLVVFMFVKPLSLFGWLTSGNATPPKPPASQATTSGAAVPAPPQRVAGIAQAANPNSQQQTTVPGRLVRRDWFHLSDPAIHPQLHEAADLMNKGMREPARGALDKIGRPDDANVANLSAYVHLMGRAPERLQRAYEAHLTAAKAGHPKSMHQIGQMLRLGTVGPPDLAAATDWFERGAAAGYAVAATEAGRAYYNGWARAADYEKAAAYYRQAAEAGDAWGMHNYGTAFLNGRGVAFDQAKGREWVEKSANTGLANAQRTMATLARKEIGGPRDLDAFVRWSQMAANQGLADAAYDLGMFFLEPEDSRPADPARAAGYLRQAALKKHTAAQFAYATLCERGVGMPPNNVQAFVYYSLALRGGQTAAQQRLDDLRNRMSAQDIATAQKLVSAAG